MTERLNRDFGRFDLDLLDSSEYLEMPPSTRNQAYLYMLALTGWSRKRLTDGVVPVHVTRDLAARMQCSSSTLLRVLSKVGLVHVSTDSILLTKFKKWQETREQVEGRRRSQNERQTRFRNALVTRDTVEMSHVSHAAREEKRREEITEEKKRYAPRDREKYSFGPDNQPRGVGEPPPPVLEVVN